MKTVDQNNRRKEQTPEVTEEESKPNKKINLPYIQGANEQLRRTFNRFNIKPTFYTPTTLRSLLSKPKDPIPKEDRNNLIYQLDCKDCEAVYVGEIKRTLNIKINAHISAVKSASREATLHNTVGNTTMTLIGITREYWILKRIGKPR